MVIMGYTPFMTKLIGYLQFVRQFGPDILGIAGHYVAASNINFSTSTHVAD